MNEEFLKAKSAKLNIPLEEMKSKWDEFKTNGLELGISEDKIDEHIRFRINKYYLKLEREPIIEGKFQPLTVDKTDYGVMRQYSKAVEAYNIDPESAVKEGLTTSDGVPIQQNGFNKGKPINIETAFTVIYDGYFIPKGSDDKRLGKFRLGGKDVDSFNFKLGNIYDVKGIKSQKQQSGSDVLIIGKSDYIPVLAVERTYEQIKEDVSSFFNGKLVTIPKLKDYCSAQLENDIRYPVAVVKGNIYNLTITNDKQQGDIIIQSNNRIELMAEDESFEIHTVGGWVPKMPELEFNFSENSQDVIIVGTVREREDKETGVKIAEFSKVMGIFVADEFRKEVTESVENTKEVTDSDVDNFISKEEAKPIL